MITQLKFIIIAVAGGFFMYCASLAFQGNLDMETVSHDIGSLLLYVKNLLQIWLQKYL
jgi:hypothetical protein